VSAAPHESSTHSPHAAMLERGSDLADFPRGAKALRSGPRALVASAALLLLAPACGFAQSGSASTSLVPARQVSLTDALGFEWDIEPRTGTIRDATNGCLSGTGTTTINGQNFHCPQPMMDPNTGELVLRNVLAGLEVTRRMRVDSKVAALRWVDSYRNPGGASFTASVIIRILPGFQCGSVLSDGGSANPSGLGKNEGGVVLVSPNSSYPSILLALAGSRSKLKPAFTNNNNYECAISWSVTIPAGKTVSLVQSLAQRQPGPVDAKSLADQFKPLRARAWIRDLPDDVRRSIVNFDGSGGPTELGGRGFAAGLPEDLAAMAGARDVLALGGETRLHGTAILAGLSIETRHGKLPLAPESLAALVGPGRAAGGALAYLRDGQVLAGVLRAEQMRFALPSGVEMALGVEDLDRLVLAERADAPAASPRIWALIDTGDGDRLAIALPAGKPLEAATPWGTRVIAPEEIRSVRVLEGDQPGHRIDLADGSRFFVFLGDRPWPVETLLFGAREIRPASLRGLVVAAEKAPAEDAAAEITEPHVLLAGGNVLVGRIELAELHLLAEGESVPLPPDQIKCLHNEREGEAPEVGEPERFRAELWDGGVVAGTLQESMLPLRSGDWTGRIPARDVVDVFVPVAVVPEAMRAKIAGLVRDLGDAEWATRESAHGQLAELGGLARAALDEALLQSEDPEVRKRAKALLEGIAR